MHSLYGQDFAHYKYFKYYYSTGQPQSNGQWRTHVDQSVVPLSPSADVLVQVAPTVVFQQLIAKLRWGSVVAVGVWRLEAVVVGEVALGLRMSGQKDSTSQASCDHRSL